MRATTLHDTLVAAIQAIEPRHQASAADRFHWLDDPTADPDPNYPDRTFFVVPDSYPWPSDRYLAAAQSMQPNPKYVRFQVAVLYGRAPGVVQRILDDGEQIADAILALQTGGQIHTIRIEPGSAAEAPTHVVSTLVVEIEYDNRPA